MLPGQTTDANVISWLLKQSPLHPQNKNQINMIPYTQLPTIATDFPLLRQIYNRTLAPTPTPPTQQYGNLSITLPNGSTHMAHSKQENHD